MEQSVENFIPEEVLMPLLRERLGAGQAVRWLPFRGVSMLPMLRQGKDSVELAPLPEKLKKYDLPVYQYPSGKYVMHRVVDVKDTHYICIGDNLTEKETVYPEQMIGVVSAFRRGQKRISVEDPGYRLYCRIWVALFPLRRWIKRMKHSLWRLLS